jgi:hypothetical protein
MLEDIDLFDFHGDLIASGKYAARVAIVSMT